LVDFARNPLTARNRVIWPDCNHAVEQAAFPGQTGKMTANPNCGGRIIESPSAPCLEGLLAGWCTHMRVRHTSLSFPCSIAVPNNDSRQPSHPPIRATVPHLYAIVTPQAAMADLYTELHADLYGDQYTRRYNGYPSINAKIKTSVKKWASRTTVKIKAVGMKLGKCMYLLPIALNSRRTATDIYVAVKGGIKSFGQLFEVRSSGSAHRVSGRSQRLT
jgi:hypothetical protein